MGQSEKKINIGKFVNQMQWFQPVGEKKDSGFIRKTYNPAQFFLADITSCQEVVEKNEYESVKKNKITFVSWKQNVSTDWKVQHDGIKYNIVSINHIGNRLYAEYNAISE